MPEIQRPETQREASAWRPGMAAARLRLRAFKAAEIARRESAPAEPPSAEARRLRFRVRLNAEIHRNAASLAASLPDFLGRRLRPSDLLDVSEERDAALAEWERRLSGLAAHLVEEPERLEEARRVMEEALFRRFSGRINALRQQALGIDRYVWRSRDDEKVRPLHARHDDRVFFWDEPPEGGHPGEAWNCRCWAEPFVEEEAEAPPETGLTYRLGLSGAAVGGVADAARDFALDNLRSLGETLEDLPAARRLVFLLRREARGELTDAERAELDGVREAARDKAEAFFRDAPELAKALGAYLLALQRRPALLDEAYRQGLVTRQEVEAAYRERAYVDTLVLLNVSPVSLALRAGKLTRLRNLAGDAKALVEAFAREAARLRRRLGHVGHNVVDNPGIVWGRGIKEQGIPWEDALEATGQFGQRLPQNFKTIDFYDPVTKTATSAKTLDTTAGGYARNPSRIFSAVKRYVDRTKSFDGREGLRQGLEVSEIQTKKIELAVPEGTTKEQIVQLRRAVRYAESQGVELKVSFIR
ncbi:hypothetical protein CLD20_08920 [Afifella sp. IM 167]|nr:hypothetical protein [Afifella sp. IM 167]